MKPKASLSQALQGHDRRGKGAPAAPAASTGKFREGRKAVTLYLTPEGRRQLRTLVAERDVTQEQLLAEALNDLFVKHRKAPLA